MITTSDSPFTISLNDRYIILPSDGILLEKYIDKKIKFENTKKGFSYNSRENENFLNISQIRNLIIKNLDENFKPF